MFKKYLPTSLFGRTFLIVMIPVLLLQIAVSVVFFERHWSKMTERLASAVTGEISAIIAEIELTPDNSERVERIEKIAIEHLNFSVHYTKDEKVFPERIGDGETGVAKALALSLSNTVKHPFQINVKGIEKRVDVDILMEGGLLRVIVPEGRLYSASSYIFILWMLGLSLLLFTIAMIFMRNQIRPIYRLGVIAERLGRGIPVGRIKPTGAREVRQAAEAFVNMQDRINNYINQRTTMLAGVSHDLRTPLTRMKLQLEMMDDGEDKQALQSDIADMEHMIEGYLSFAKGDGGEEMQRTNFKDLMDKIIEDAKRLPLTVQDERDLGGGITLWVRPIALKRAFGNFVSNAAQFSNTLRISIKNADDSVKIYFDDDGEGIPTNRLEDVLKPFVRGELSRNQKTGGVGLGLTIANDIILAHGGKINLSKSDMGGLSVIVTLPL